MNDLRERAKAICTLIDSLATAALKCGDVALAEACDAAITQFEDVC